MNRNLMISLLIALTMLALAFAGCSSDEKDNDEGQDDNEPPVYTIPVFATNQSVFTEAEIRAVVYTSYRYAGDLYTENVTGSSLSYVEAPFDMASKYRTEYSTNDRGVAYNMSKASIMAISSKYELKNETQTEKYFEFEWCKEGTATTWLMRVHKESYINRTNMTTRPSGNYIGTFNVRPMTTHDIDEVIEYLLWVEEYYRGGIGYKLLSSFTVEEGGAWVQHLYMEAEWQTDNGDSTTHVDVDHFTYTVDKASGEILGNGETVMSLTA